VVLFATGAANRKRSHEMVVENLIVGPALGSEYQTRAHFYATTAFLLPNETAARAHAENAWSAIFLHEQNRIDETAAMMSS
jgi:hypothetical protein